MNELLRYYAEEPRVDNALLRRVAQAPPRLNRLPSTDTRRISYGDPNADRMRNALIPTKEFIQSAVGEPVNQLVDWASVIGYGDKEAADRIVRRVGEAVTDPFMGTFAGRGAKTADLVALSRAEQMLKGLKRGTPEWEAADRAAWRETGWTHAFPDGKPRFEIDDSAAGFKEGMSLREDYKPIASSKIYEHGDLYSAYPSAKKIGVSAGGPSYNPASDSIQTSRPGSSYAKGDLTHELQHAIQEREDFARGGSSHEFATQYMNPSAEVAKIPEIQKTYGRAVSDIYSYQLPREVRTEIRQEMRELGFSSNEAGWSAIDASLPKMPSLDKIDNFSMVVESLMEKRPDLAQHLTPLLSALEDYWVRLKRIDVAGGEKVTPHQQYKSLAGEAEARLTQSRMDYDAAKRRDIYPPDEFDVPVSEQVVRFR